MYSYEANGRGNISATEAKLLERKSQFINLPAVTPEDDGTVLGVAEGKWQPVPGGGGGGGWPADLPKPSVGGYGYTEQVEQTTITWDGDTEGRDSIQNRFYKVSDLTPPESAISNGTLLYSDEETSYPVGQGVEFGDIAIVFAEEAILLASSSGQVVTKDITFDIPSAGLYFAKEDDWFTTSLTYGGDAVHKIDKRYLSDVNKGEAPYSHAEGTETTASGETSHAEGNRTTASGIGSHAEGYGTTASGDFSHAEGRWNISDINTFAHIIGNGISDDNRHNCFMVDWNGGIYVQASDDASKMMKITVASDGTITATEATV